VILLTLAARGQSACGPFVSGCTRRGDTRVAWARSQRLSSRGAKGLRSANAPRAAQVRTVRSTPAARAEATRVSHGRGASGFPLAERKGYGRHIGRARPKCQRPVRLRRHAPRRHACRMGAEQAAFLSRSERATVGKCVARAASEGGPFVCGGTRRRDTRVAWARSKRLSSRGAKGLRSANAPRAAQVRAAGSSAAAPAEATRVSHGRGVNGPRALFPCRPIFAWLAGATGNARSTDRICQLANGGVTSDRFLSDARGWIGPRRPGGCNDAGMAFRGTGGGGSVAEPAAALPRVARLRARVARLRRRRRLEPCGP